MSLILHLLIRDGHTIILSHFAINVKTFMHIFGFFGNFIINMSYISRIAASFSRQLDQAVGAGPFAVVPGRHLRQPLADNDS